MPFQVGPSVTPVLGRARTALGLTQRTLGEMFGVSMRTAHRWEGGEAHPDVAQVLKLAREVFPVDGRLAEQLAKEAGTTLVEMGLVEARQTELAASSPPQRPLPPIVLLVDSIVMAAIDAIDADAPTHDVRQVARSMMGAAFARARSLGLTIDEVDAALASPTRSKAGRAKK